MREMDLMFKFAELRNQYILKQTNEEKKALYDKYQFIEI